MGMPPPWKLDPNVDPGPTDIPGPTDMGPTEAELNPRVHVPIDIPGTMDIPLGPTDIGTTDITPAADLAPLIIDAAAPINLSCGPSFKTPLFQSPSAISPKSYFITPYP